MPEYICIHPTSKHEKGDIINRNKFKRLTESEKLYFTEYNPIDGEKSFAEQIEDGIIEQDKEEK